MACMKQRPSVTNVLLTVLCILVMFQALFFCNHDRFVSPITSPPQSTPKAQLQGGVKLVADITVENPRGTIFTCTSSSFYYAKHFLYSYTGIGFNVRVYQADKVRLNGKWLPVHWCRVRLLATGYDIGPAPLLYSDADARVNVTELEAWIRPYVDYDGLIFSTGTTRNAHEKRTNWFVLPVPKGARTMKIVMNWASHARNVGLQDQQVLSEIYPRCNKDKGLLCRPLRKMGISSWHCGSHSRSRASCMRDMIHRKEKIPKYRKSI